MLSENLTKNFLNIGFSTLLITCAVALPATAQSSSGDLDALLAMLKDAGVDEVRSAPSLDGFDDRLAEAARLNDELTGGFNENGELRVPWGYVAALQSDPIEKKPFFHVLPGSNALTFGMLGCDFHCSYCQNWVTSQAMRDPAADIAVGSVRKVTPQGMVELARRSYRLAMQLAHYDDLRGLMSTWRWLHRWLALLLGALLVVHVTAAMRYGGVDLGALFAGGPR